ncbi:hypothetical protein WJX72_011159 [[Myrmecia] bisecta]|uniref:LisH domain-containing protein n=1 Tax=[Myrmecia] bisecta TaxID=41462 RepID=A0AAW1PU05_9CHLO
MAAKTLLKEATNPNNDVVDQVAALNRLSELLEAEERRFVDLIGDPQWSPNQRGHFAIGRMLAGLKDEEEMFDNITEHWLQNRRAPLEQCVAALRFLLACLTCWQFQFPLTEDSLVEKLHEWVREEGARPPTRHDPAPADEQALLEEARHTYAIGLLAVTLGNEQRCDEAVRNGLVSRLACYLKQAILGTRAQEAAAGNEPVRSAAASVADAAGLVKDPQAGILGEKAHKRHVDDPPSSSSLVAEANAGPIQQPPFPPPQHIQEQAMALRTLRERYCVQCLACMGEYLECLGPVLAEQGLAVLCELMRSWRTSHAGIVDALRLLCSLVAHRRFAELFVDAGGIQLLLALPQTPHTRGGLSLALFGFASLPLAFERVCALPTAIPSQLVETVLALLSSGFDPARKNASLFLGAALHFRAVLDAFDRQDGLRRLLALLRTCVLLLRGANAADIRVEKQVGYHASHALQQYFRTHLVLHVATLKRRQAGQGAPKQAVLPAYRPVDVGQDAVDATIWALETDRKLYEAFVRSKWAALEDFMDYGGPGLMLDLIQACPGERYFNEMAQYALDVLHTATLMPYTRRNVVGCIASNQRSGMAVVLSAAGGQAYLADHEVMQSALLVLANCVSAPPSLAPLLPPLAQAAPKGGAPAEVAAATPSVGPWRSYRYLAGPSGSPPREVQASTSAEPMGAPAAEHAGTAATVGQHIEGSYQFARAALRANNGIRVLLGLLQSRSSMPASHVDKLRALTLRTLLGLARDPSIRHILAKLQVGRLMAELVHEPAASGSMRRLPASAGEEGPGDTYPGANWHAAFNKMALELIALTTSAAHLSAATGASTANTPGGAPSAVKKLHIAPALLQHTRHAHTPATSCKAPQSEPKQLRPDASTPSDLLNTSKSRKRRASSGPLADAAARSSAAAEPACATPAPLSRASIRAAVQSPPETTGRLGEPAPLRNHSTPAAIVSSKLNSIVMQYLRHQHRQACMAAAAPISTLPPMSLLRPHTLPQAKRTLEAPVNVTARTLRRQASGQHGGFGGRRQQRHFLYSRFRHLRSVRDADASVFKSCTFLHKSSVLVVGTHAGELKFTDPRTAEVVEVYEAHSAPVNMLKVHERGSTSLLLSSSREQVILWNANNMETGPLATWEGCRGGVFSSTGSRAACIGFPFRQAFIYDVATCSALLTLDDANAGTGSGERSWRSGRDSMCYSPSDELLLWGPQLWDPRAPRAIHRFDQFSDMTGGGTFQMAGLEIIMNSEVWDLRTFKLLRSAPCLDATTLTFNAAGDVMYATLRRTTDDLGNALHPRRAKHALHTAFRTVDATDYTEIATLDADQRCVLDLCVDPEDAYIGVVTVEPQEGMSSSARIYGVGRRRLQDDDSENEDENDDGRPSDDEDESQDEDDGPAAYAELLGDDIAHEGQGREAPPQHADAPEDASNPGDASDGLGRDADEAESDADIESDLDLSELAGSADSEGGDEDSDPEGAMDWAEGAYLAGEDDMSSDGEWATDDGEPESDAPSFESDYGDDESD